MARYMGACEKVDGITGWRSLCHVLMSPSGVEFMEEHKGFPELSIFRMYSDKILEYGIYVDCGVLHMGNVDAIFAVGNTTINASYRGAKVLHRVIVMHGAEVNIKALDYAVVKVYNLGGVINVTTDETAKIL